jgi:hypothetical protein
MTDVAPEAVPAPAPRTVTIPKLKLFTPSATSPVAEPNPLANAITSFIGSANVQKTLAGLQVGIAGLTNAEGKTIGMKLGAMSIGAAYGLIVHYFDLARAKLGR